MKIDLLLENFMQKKKPNPAWKKIPEDNNTDNIEYEAFTIEFSGYEDVNVE